MKISNSQYAQALYESVAEKNQQEVDVAISGFVKILKKNSQIKNGNQIIKKFSEIWNKNRGILEAEVISREKLDRDLRGEIEKYIEKKYNRNKVEIVEIVDTNIKGGIIIRVGDEVMDGSVARQLKELKNSLEK